MKIKVRFLGSLIKYFIYLSVILIAAGAALFWFDTGDWLVLPLAERAGNFFLDPLKLEIENIKGSVRNGYSIEGVKLISGDENLLTLKNFSASPDWDLALQGMNGLPFIKSLNINGVSTDLEKVIAISNHFSSTEDEKEIESDDEKSFTVKNFNPVDISITDINFGTPYSDLKVNEINLDKNGNFNLDSKLISGDKIFPFSTKAKIDFDSLSILSSDLKIGNNGSGKFSGSLEPLKANLDLTALSLEEILTFSPVNVDDLKASGRIDGKISADSDGEKIKASGVISMPRANVADIPFNFRMPFEWDGEKIFDLILDSNIKSFPFKTNTKINFDSSEVLSDLKIGTKGSGKLSGTLNPLKTRLDLTALSLEEILSVLPVDVDNLRPSGRIDGRIFADHDGDSLKASGVLSMPRANIADIPLNFRLPFNWNGGNIFEINDASLNTAAAGVKLNALTDISAMKIKANGEAKNISLNEIGKIFAPDLKLKGEGGYLNFDVDAVMNSEILKNAKADINASIPQISLKGLDIVNSLRAYVKLKPDEAPKISLDGKVFNGKLFARGEAERDNQGNIKPSAVISLVNLDVPTLINTFPDLAKSIKKPSGKISLKTNISDNLDIKADLNSDKLSANGITLTNLLANLNYDNKNGLAELENFSVNLGKGKIKASGNANVKESTFKFNAETENLDPKVIPELKQLTGIYSLKAEALGNYTKPETINAKADFTARNAGYGGMTFGNIDLPVNFANNILRINNAGAKLPGGSLKLNGTVNLKNSVNPGLDISASSDGINLAEVFKAFNIQNKSMPVSGKVKGIVGVKGALNNATVNANVRAENIKAGNLLNMPKALIEARGNMNKITLSKIEAKVNGSEVKGSGSITPNLKNINNSSVNLYTTVKHLPLKPLLMSAMGSAPVEGLIDINTKLTGTIAKPALELKVDRPIFYGKKEIKNLAVKLRSPEANHYVINTSAMIENFKPEIDIDLKKNGDIFAYKVDTKPLDLNKAIAVQTPEMSEMVKGFAKISVQGSTKPNSDIKINASSNGITLLDKIKVDKVSVPVTYMAAKNKVEIKNAEALLSDGVINSNANLDLNKSEWNGKIKVNHIDFGKLATKFLPEGELVGVADAEVSMKGGFNVMPMSFATGKFSTKPGYIHKHSIIDRVSPTKKITFENISGSFFWDGRDLFFNPGTRAKAGNDEPLYRYFDINGSMGIPGKGLNLFCEGRFDLRLLDRLLGAMKGLFQYTVSGGLAGTVLRDAAGRVLGVKRRDFQNVSFKLTNSWTNLGPLNLKITKPIEDFLPIDLLNKDTEQQKDDTQFKLNIKIPVGEGDKSIEEESTADQFKRQLIDNLFNIGM